MHAIVYKCFRIEDTKQEKPYAVKVVREEDEEKIQAHKNEFEITKSLSHKNIVTALEIYVNDQRKEIHQVMEMVDGQEIFDQIIELGAYGEMQAQHIFRQVMEGIAHLHAHSVCHRDIKPSNILVDKNQHVFIADFNVAKKQE